MTPRIGQFGVEEQPLEYSPPDCGPTQYYPEDGDLLLWTPSSHYGRAVAAATGGPYGHVSAVSLWNGDAYSVGYDEARGGVAEPLLACLALYPGKLHVYRVRHERFERSRESITRGLRRHIGMKYRWQAIRLITITWLPILRLLVVLMPVLREWFAAKVVKASQSTREGICSQHVAREFGAFDVRFINNKPFALVSPNDIANSAITEYVGTLYASQNAVMAYWREAKENATSFRGV